MNKNFGRFISKIDLEVKLHRLLNYNDTDGSDNYPRFYSFCRMNIIWKMYLDESNTNLMPIPNSQLSEISSISK